MKQRSEKIHVLTRSAYMWTCSQVGERTCLIRCLSVARVASARLCSLSNSDDTVFLAWMSTVAEQLQSCKCCTRSCKNTQELLQLRCSPDLTSALQVESCSFWHIAAFRAAFAETASFSSVTWTKKLWFYIFCWRVSNGEILYLYVLLTAV